MMIVKFYCYCFLHDLYMFLRLWVCNSRISEEHFVCYEMSQCKWVIIKVFYRCLRRCLLGWHRSRLGFVTLYFGEVSLGPLGNTHQECLASIVTNELVAGWSIKEWVKRLADNEIELGMKRITLHDIGELKYRSRCCYHKVRIYY